MAANLTSSLCLPLLAFTVVASSACDGAEAAKPGPAGAKDQGPTQDERANQALDLVEKVSTEVHTRATSNESPAAGIASAQAYFDEHKAELETHMATLTKMRRTDMSKETQARFEKFFSDNVVKIMTLPTSVVPPGEADEALSAAVTKLVDAYSKVVTQ